MQYNIEQRKMRVVDQYEAGIVCVCIRCLPSGEVDEQTTRDMVKLALDSGVDYFTLGTSE